MLNLINNLRGRERWSIVWLIQQETISVNPHLTKNVFLTWDNGIRWIHVKSSANGLAYCNLCNSRARSPRSIIYITVNC